MKVRPIKLRDARRFIGEHHRHNLPPVGWLFGVGLEADGGELAGVGIAGRPTGRGFDDGLTVEILRTCTLGDRNANSMIYGALCRAAFALGYERAITYTLAEESGASLRGAGFVIDELLPARSHWNRADCQTGPRLQVDLFGNERRPSGPKVRWVRTRNGRPTEAERPLR